jgi:hypothetical protein
MLDPSRATYSTSSGVTRGSFLSSEHQQDAVTGPGLVRPRRSTYDVAPKLIQEQGHFPNRSERETTESVC